jgi:hypothetical protein
MEYISAPRCTDAVPEEYLCEPGMQWVPVLDANGGVEVQDDSGCASGAPHRIHRVVDGPRLGLTAHGDLGSGSEESTH